MFFKRNKNKKTEQTPIEWLVGYLKEFNCIQDTLSTRKAIEEALKMERNKFRLHDVIKNEVAVCPECGCNKVQKLAGDNYSCMNAYCEWQTVL